jgi:Lrp/AsnC family leucine-responsive transcriptional regulator
MNARPISGRFCQLERLMSLVMSEVDQFDARILGVLESKGRISWAELSSEVHLSPTAVADRVRRMERQGTIRGYRAEVDPAVYGRTTRAVIEVGLIAGAHAEEFETRLRTRDEIAFAAYVTGSSDYSLQCECKGSDGLDALVRWLRADPAVARTETRFILRVVRDGSNR